MNSLNYFKSRADFYYIVIIVLLTLYLSLYGLNNHSFWDDEAYVAVIAKNFLKTGEFTGWDGRNLFSYRNGALLAANLHAINPPADSLIAAVSFKIFGVSTWAGRLPFVLFGLGSLFIFWLLLKEDFPDRKTLWLYALTLVSLSYSFLLNIRQCRYYALVIFFGIASYYFYKKCVRDKKTVWFILLALSLVCLFYANYLLCAAFMGGILLVHLVFYLKNFSVKDWLKMLLAAFLFIALTMPYTVWLRLWERRDIDPAMQSPPLIKTAILLYQNLRELDLIGYLPGVMIIAGVILVVVYRREKYCPPALFEWLVLIIGYIVVLSLLSIQPAVWQGWNGGLADIRYLNLLIPFCAGCMAAVLYIIHQIKFGKLISIFLLLLLMFTNILSFRIARPEMRWLLPAYFVEINTKFDSAYDAAIKFLKKSAAQDDMVYTIPEYALGPIMFYLGDRLKMQGTLRENVHFSKERMAQLKAPLFISDTYPHWIISFGLTDATQQMLQFFSRDQYTYGCNAAFTSCSYSKRLDVFGHDMTRPELPWHSFGPFTEFDVQSAAIYIFQRKKRDAAFSD